MRILYHHRTLADGAEGIHIQEMVDAFEKLGHQVSMHALAGSSTRGVGATSDWSRLKAALPQALFELAAIAYNGVDYFKMRSRIRVEKPDLVYKRHAIYDVGVALAARHAGLPVLLEANAAYSSPGNLAFERVCFPKLALAFERLAINRATLVAVVSTPMADYFRPLARDPSRVVVVPNGANPERFTPQSQASSAVRERLHLRDAFVVGWSGIIRDWHRLDLLLETLTALPEARLLIVGDGPDRERLLAAASELGVRDRVHVTGRVRHEQVPEYVAAFDVAVAAHDGTGYASPMKLLEYMAMGLPVVAPRQANIEDFIKDGINGLLFKPGDSGALADTLTRLLQAPPLRLALGKAARETIVRERNWYNIAKEVLRQTLALREPHRDGERR